MKAARLFCTTRLRSPVRQSYRYGSCRKDLPTESNPSGRAGRPGQIEARCELLSGCPRAGTIALNGADCIRDGADEPQPQMN